EVRENEKKILLKEDSLNIREKNLENDVHALQLKREELARLEQKINHSREQIIKAKEQLSILDEKLKEMQIYEVKINEKKKELENLKPKEDELAHRETMLQKEKEIDRKRKEHLDNRVKKIRQVEQRLQIEADDNLE
ncbi:MAG: hypothetical protein KGJ90_05370, partial [Patescibacteria group bacterium]|nr:hypothetical protein [Patescibacteria group bacterium]